MAPPFVVQVAGRNLQSVRSMSLRLSMRELADSVDVEVNDRIPLADLREGSSMAVALHLPGQDPRVVLVGEVMNIRKGKTPTSRTLGISGFSAAQRLTKSSLVIGDGLPSRNIVNQSLRTIVTQVVKPFGLVVDVGEGLESIADAPISMRIKKNETAWDFLQRACRRQGCILVSGAASVNDKREAKASVRISRNAARTSPVQIRAPHPRVLVGPNYELDARALHSNYIVKAKSKKRKAQGGLERDSDGTIIGLDGEAIDTRMRYSPLLLDADAGAKAKGELGIQAEWEARKRSAEAFRVTVTVDGWSPNSSQALWWPNTLYPFVDEEEGFSGDLLLASVTLIYDGTGQRAELELMPPDAYAVLDDFTVDDASRRGRGGRGGWRPNKEWLAQHADTVTKIDAANDTVDFDRARLDLIFTPPEDDDA